MRAPARAFASVVWMTAVVSAGSGAAGCGTAHRPDADVARAVEAADRRRLASMALASADDELPVALPVAGRIAADAGPGAAPQPVARVPGNGAADRFFSATPEERSRSFMFSLESNPSLADDGTADAAGRPEGSNGKPHLRLQLFQFTVLGRPVGLRCGIKNKLLMFGAKITL